MYIFLKKYISISLVLTFFIIGFVLYLDIIFYDFVTFDDFIYLNKLYSNNLSMFDSLVWAFTDVVNYNWSPVTLISMLIDFNLYGLNSGGYHFTNLLLHCVNTTLLFLILCIIWGDKKTAYIVAFIFLVHPINVETVAWFSERKGVLGAFFSLLTLFLYLKYYVSHSHRKTFYILALLCFLLAVLSKATYITLPLITILITWYRNKIILNKTDFVKEVYNISPFLLISLVVGLITIYIHMSTGAIVDSVTNPLSARLSNALNSFIIYVKQVFYPFNLAAHYKYVPISNVDTIVNLLIVFGVFCIVYIKKMKYYYILFGLLWYSILVLPSIGIIQSGYHAHADRYTYLPLIGIFIIVVLFFSKLLTKIKLKSTNIYLFGFMFAFIIMSVTWVQHHTWRNSRYLFEHAYSVDATNYVVISNLARIYIREGHVSNGIAMYEKAKFFAPYYINMYDTISHELVLIDKPELAINVLTDLITYNKNFNRAYIKISTIRIKQQFYSKAIQILLKIPNKKEDDAEVNYLLGYSYIQLGQKVHGISILKKSIQSKFFGMRIKALIKTTQ